MFGTDDSSLTAARTFGNDLTELDDKAIESELTRMAAHLYAGTARWLLLIGEFDRRERWADWGCRSAVQWLSWRVGLAPRAARDHVRVGRALLELPKTRAEFCQGRLSYSAVRAITRVARPETEDDFINLAHHMTADQLEKAVRAYRGALNELDRQKANERRAFRYLTYRYDDNGDLIIHGRLPAEDGAVVVAALDAVVARLKNDGEEPGYEGCGAGSVPAGTPRGDARDDATPAEPDGPAANATVAASADPVPSGTVDPAADPGEGAGGGPEASGSAEPPPAGALSHQEPSVSRLPATPAPSGSGPPLPPEAGCDVHGESPTAGEGSAAASRGDSKPKPRVSPPVRAADALVVLAETALREGVAPVVGGDRIQVVVHADIAALRDGDPAGMCELRDGPGVPPETALRLACDASIVHLLEKDGEPLDIGRKSRVVPRGMRRALEARDRGCRFPGCARRGFVDCHHVSHWTRDGGETKLDNLVLLCRFHHILVHEGGFGVARAASGELLFTMPDGEPLPGVPVFESPDDETIRELNAYLGLAIDDTTFVSEWDGHHPDYRYITDVLMQPVAFIDDDGRRIPA